MPNKNYIAGRAYEYKAKKLLVDEGYQVIRASGSHGAWDLIAIRDGEPVRCIQIKRTQSPNGVKQLFGKFRPQLNGGASTHYVHELWIWYKGKWHFQ